MLDKLARLFGQPAPGSSEQVGRHLAMAVLLVETARADFTDADAERAVMRDGLVSSLGLDAADADALVERAFAHSHDAVSLHEFLVALNAELDLDGKRNLLEWLWRVAYADGRVDPMEEARIRQLADLLFLPHGEFVRIRLKVAGEAAD